MVWIAYSKSIEKCSEHDSLLHQPLVSRSDRQTFLTYTFWIGDPYHRYVRDYNLPGFTQTYGNWFLNDPTVRTPCHPRIVSRNWWALSFSHQARHWQLIQFKRTRHCLVMTAALFVFLDCEPLNASFPACFIYLKRNTPRDTVRFPF